MTGSTPPSDEEAGSEGTPRNRACVVRSGGKARSNGWCRWRVKIEEEAIRLDYLENEHERTKPLG